MALKYLAQDPSWAPTSDQYIYFDNFRIATTPLAGSGNNLAVADVETTSPLAVIDEVGSNRNAVEPEIGAAKAIESGGGGFHGLLIGLLVLLRRKNAGRSGSSDLVIWGTINTRSGWWIKASVCQFCDEISYVVCVISISNSFPCF